MVIDIMATLVVLYCLAVGAWVLAFLLSVLVIAGWVAGFRNPYRRD